MKKIGVLGLITIMLLGLIGCGQTSSASSLTENAVVISKDGRITGVYVDVFDREYYSTEGLEAMAKEEIADYNQKAGSEKISFDKIELDQDKLIRLYLKYADSTAFAEFNDVVFYQGTVSEAYQNGISLDTTLKSVGKEAKTIYKDDLLKMGDSHIVVIGMSALIQLPQNVTYISEGATVTSGKREIKADFDQDLIYIIYK